MRLHGLHDMKHLEQGMLMLSLRILHFQQHMFHPIVRGVADLSVTRLDR